MLDAQDEKTFLNKRILVVSLIGGTPVAVVAATSVEQSHGAFAGKLQAGDIVLSIKKAAKQAGLVLEGARVDSAGLLQVEYSNVTAGPITPTATEAHTLIIAR